MKIAELKQICSRPDVVEVITDVEFLAILSLFVFGCVGLFVSSHDWLFTIYLMCRCGMLLQLTQSC